MTGKQQTNYGVVSSILNSALETQTDEKKPNTCFLALETLLHLVGLWSNKNGYEK